MQYDIALVGMAGRFPGARNVPLDTDDFVDGVVQKASGSKIRKVVLYCASPTCDASTQAATLLITAGFTNVIEYEGGLSAWNTKKAATPRASSTR